MLARETAGPSPRQTAGAGVEQGEGGAACQQREQPDGENGVTKTGDKGRLEQMEKDFNGVGPAGLEVEEGFGHRRGALLHHGAGKARQPALIRMDERIAGEGQDSKEKKEGEERQKRQPFPF